MTRTRLAPPAPEKDSAPEPGTTSGNMRYSRTFPPPAETNRPSASSAPDCRWQEHARTLDRLAGCGMLRTLPAIDGEGKYVRRLPVPRTPDIRGADRRPPEAGAGEARPLLNLSSNDYLGLLERTELRQEFSERYGTRLRMSSASSRLLTGNCEACFLLEKELSGLYGKEAALLFNSGYHANTGILPALAGKEDLIVADKLVHASIIDGIKLSGCDFARFRHNDIGHLERILRKEAGIRRNIYVVTESIFSMDGDTADLAALVRIRNRYPQVILYVDEAHAFGVCGSGGLGLVRKIEEETGGDLLSGIDLWVATFGKALSSVGAFLLCTRTVREYLVNRMRPLIFSTALPEINIAWSRFLLEKLPSFARERQQLAEISELLRNGLDEIRQRTAGGASPEENRSASQIVPFITGDPESASAVARYLQAGGFYALPVRPPTVPEGTSRIRFSLSASLTREEILRLLDLIGTI